jgi:hypothetical protein
MRADTGRSRQGQFISDKERARMNEIQKQLRELNKKKDLPRKELFQILIYNN